MSSPSIWAPVVAGGVGGAVTLLGAAFQRRHDVRQELARARSKQVEEAAVRCEARLRSIDDVLQQRHWSSIEADEDAWLEREERIESVIAEIQLESALLPDPYRGRVTFALEVLRRPRGVAENHWQAESNITAVARRELHDLFAAAIRGDDPPPRPPLIIEYEYALAWYAEEQDELYAHEETRSSMSHESFLNRHPEISAEIRAEQEAANQATTRRWWARLARRLRG